MRTTVRAADLEADRSSTISLFRENLNPHFDERRFDWTYHQSPHGVASLWVLEDTTSEAIVGAAAALPRQLQFGNIEVRGYVLADFCIHPSLRTLGPALQLQRACLEGIGANSSAVWYDFPSDAMTAVYRRLGIEPQSQLVRLVKVLRADRILAKKLKSAPAKGFIGAAANSMLAARDSIRPRSRSLRIERHQGPCGFEFTELAQQTCKPSEVCISHTAEYLNWRFVSHPSRQFDILTARDGNNLTGYLILTRDGDDAQIVSLRSVDDDRILSELILSALADLRNHAVVNVNASLLASDPRALLLEKLGFRRRESRPIAFSNSSFPQASGNENVPVKWHLMDGDRDN